MGRGGEEQLLLAEVRSDPAALTVEVARAFSEIAGNPGATVGYCETAAYVLAALMARDGHRPCFAYDGVTLPDGTFAAHCWVELDGEIHDPTAGQFGVSEGFYIGRDRRTALYRYSDAPHLEERPSAKEHLLALAEEGGSDADRRIERVCAEFGFRLSPEEPTIRLCQEGEAFCWFDGSLPHFVLPSPNGAWHAQAQVLNAYDGERLLGSLVFYREQEALMIEALSLKPGARDGDIDRQLLAAALTLYPGTELRCLYPEDEQLLSLL